MKMKEVTRLLGVIVDAAGGEVRVTQKHLRRSVLGDVERLRDPDTGDLIYRRRFPVVDPSE